MARILRAFRDLSREEAVAHLHGRPVAPGEAEATAQRSSGRRRQLNDPKSCWITTSKVARIPGLTLRQAMAGGRRHP